MSCGKTCECGCGSPVKRTRRFVSGHNARGMVRTPQHRRRIAEAQRKAWARIKLPGQKRCPRCGETKPDSDFGVRTTGYLRSLCRPCSAASHREWDQRNPGRAKAVQRRARFYVEHGIREADYEALLAAQQGRCAICDTSKPGRRSRFSIDHCHKTNEIRGLLCDACNLGIGSLRDDPALLRKAADYLETARTGKRSESRRGRQGGKVGAE